MEMYIFNIVYIYIYICVCVCVMPKLVQHITTRPKLTHMYIYIYIYTNFIHLHFSQSICQQ